MTDAIPKHAIERLKGLRREGHPGGIFTSDFSVNEFLLVRKAGFEPVGLCVGSCIYHLGIQYSSWTSNQEMTVLSQAMYHARELAMERMREEAKDMGADGIVGVRLTVKRTNCGMILTARSNRRLLISRTLDVIAFLLGTGLWILKALVEGLPLGTYQPKFIIENESLLGSIFYSRYLASVIIAFDCCALVAMLVKNRNNAGVYRAGFLVLQALLFVLAIPELLVSTGGI